MLTRVILDGVLGHNFGREWNLHVGSVPEALRMIDANKPGFMQWIRANLPIYDRYRIVCKYEDGRVELLDEDSLSVKRSPVEIRFVPIPAGAGNVGRIIVGIILIIVGAFTSWAGGEALIYMGVGMVVGGIIGALTPIPKTKKHDTAGGGIASDYFNGPLNVSEECAPIPIIYGRVLAGSQAVSAALTIDKMM